MTNVLLGMMGTWLVGAGLFSIFTYPGESWKRNHSFRLIRMALGLALMAMALAEV